MRVFLAHLSEVHVTVGHTVNDGDVVGLSGNSGHSSGPHLHYEVRIDGEPIDPAAGFDIAGDTCDELLSVGGGTGGGTTGTEEVAVWHLPDGWHGWLLVASLNTELAGISPDESLVRTQGPRSLYVWPVERADLAVESAVATRRYGRIAVDPSPIEIWAIIDVMPAHAYLLSVWESP